MGEKQKIRLFFLPWFYFVIVPLASLVAQMVRNLRGSAGDPGSIPEKIPWMGNGTPLQYSCLENPMDRGAWWAAVHVVTKSRTRLSKQHFHFHPGLVLGVVAQIEGISFSN